MTKLHAAADRIEVRVARALGQAFDRLKARVPVGELERALARGDLRKANELIEQMDLGDAFEPVAGIFQDAFVRGGKVGSEEIPLG